MPLFSALGLGSSFGRLQIERPTPGFSVTDSLGNTTLWDLEANGEIEIEGNAQSSSFLTLTSLSDFTAGVLVVGGKGGNGNKFVGNVPYDNGGLGGITYAEIDFKKDQVYTLFAGGAGTCDPTANFGGGGGAASGLLDDRNNPLVIAGGGGGGAYSILEANIAGLGGTGGTSDAGDIRANDLTGTIPFDVGGGTDIYAGFGYAGGSPGTASKGGKALSGRTTSAAGEGILSKYSGALGGKTGGGGGAGGYFGGGGGGDIVALGVSYSGGGGSGHVTSDATNGTMVGHTDNRRSFRSLDVYNTELPGKAFIYYKERSGKGAEGTGGEIETGISTTGIVYNQHVFKTSGVFNLTCDPNTVVEILSIGGGGSGGISTCEQKRIYNPSAYFYSGGNGGTVSYAGMLVKGNSLSISVTVGGGAAGVTMNPWPGRRTGNSGSESSITVTNGTVEYIKKETTGSGGTGGTYYTYDGDYEDNYYYEGEKTPPTTEYRTSTDGSFNNDGIKFAGDGGATPLRYLNDSPGRTIGRPTYSQFGTYNVDTSLGGIGLAFDTYGNDGYYSVGYSPSSFNDYISQANAQPNTGSGGGSIMIQTNTSTQNYLPIGAATGAGSSGLVIIRYATVTSGDLASPRFYP